MELGTLQVQLDVFTDSLEALERQAKDPILTDALVKARQIYQLLKILEDKQPK